MRMLLALALVTASLAFLPNAEACKLDQCIPDEDVTVCLDAVDFIGCQTVNTRDTVGWLYEPCTCPPIA